MACVGRPLRPAPDDFAEVFERHGWEATEVLGTNAKRVARWLDQLGRDDLKRRRRNYVLGRRLSA